ncbi:MAG: pitrilysin family protein [Myxococcota bacterium]
MTRLGLVLMFVASCAAPEPRVVTLTPNADLGWRATPPALEPGLPFRGPAVQTGVLPNNMTVAVVERHRLPVFAIHIVIQAGSADDPPGSPGCAATYAELLCPGLTVNTTVDALTISATVLDSPDRILVKALQCLRDFSVDESTIKAARNAIDLRAKGSSVEAEVHETLYPEHPYGHLARGTKEGRSALTPSTIKQFHHDHIVPERIAVIVVGPVTLSAVKRWSDEALGNWAPTAVDRPLVPAAPEVHGQLRFLAQPGSPRVVLNAVASGVPRRHPDALALSLGSAIIGRRLNAGIDALDLRVGFASRRGPGTLRIQAIAASERAAELRTAIIAELESPTVTEGELDLARRDYRNRLPAQLQTGEATAGVLGALFATGLPLDYFTALPEKLATLEATDVTRVVRAHFDPDRLSFVATGDPSLLSELGASIGNASGD